MRSMTGWSQQELDKPRTPSLYEIFPPSHNDYGRMALPTKHSLGWADGFWCDCLGEAGALGVFQECLAVLWVVGAAEGIPEVEVEPIVALVGAVVLVVMGGGIEDLGVPALCGTWRQDLDAKMPVDIDRERDKLKDHQGAWGHGQKE